MPDKYKSRFNDHLAQVQSHLPSRISEMEKQFVEYFYAKMPIMDFLALDPQIAYTIAHANYEFALNREDDQPKIQVALHEEKEGHPVTRINIIGDDMPFIVDSITAELTRLDFSIYLTIHPIFTIERNKKGGLEKVSQAQKASSNQESCVYIEASPLPEGLDASALKERLHMVLRAAKHAVTDWKTMVAKCEQAEKNVGNLSGFAQEEVDEVKDFLSWLRDKNFVFLGYIEYNFCDDQGTECLNIVDGSPLGLFKVEDLELKPKGLKALPPEVLHFARIPQLIEITKSNRKSPVHRPVHMDYIGIKRFDKQGNVIGESRFLGLFTSIVYYQSAGEIPIIRTKIERTMQRANFDPLSHTAKALRAILEFSRRDELFQMSDDDLFDYSIGVLSLEATPRVRLFVRRDAFERFVSCIIFIPRERFSTALREQIQNILCDAFAGASAAFYTQVSDSPLARVNLIIRTTPGKIPEVDTAQIEEQIAKVTNRWSDMLHEALIEDPGSQRGEKWFRHYQNAFPPSYISRYEADDARNDILHIERVLESDRTEIDLHRARQGTSNQFHLKLYMTTGDLALSDILPILEHMGFRVLEEHPFAITPEISAGETTTIWIRDFVLELPQKPALPVSVFKPLFEETLRKIWSNDISDDGLNALVVLAGLGWREVQLLRAYSRYMKQIGFGYELGTVTHTLKSHPEIAKALVSLFKARFEPSEKNDHREEQRGALVEIDHMLSQVVDLAEDRILRYYSELIQATARTNYFQTQEDGSHKPYISFKMDTSKVPDAPKPVPFAEIFVYAYAMEGIHLRGGKVARGGLRWSDRREDYRTEVLGLMKAQLVKNAVIIPTGSKGGFVLKHVPPDINRDERMELGITAYKMFLSGLLDLTDNIIDSAVVPPQQVVRHDEDDPYLVVAADKGTATFSDIANSVSESYNFWLGDAFASGGSAGYDHKKMGITARGAWVSVVRHFHEMGVDIAQEDFTVTGIGDMAGDVFGNGMLLSEHIKLVAAFNHLHIFIDPMPDPKVSYAERKRLFEMPRSSWTDYDPSLISRGGGIYNRTEKSITLSKEACNALGTAVETFSPDELIQTILKAPVDLLWNGGIGTYVKATEETHEQAGDRANNNVRVNARELRCKIIGEGGNLGLTQRGRIEYARAGGRINTDAIDNSAGVDSSDHEVNIKIAISKAIELGNLKQEDRNQTLADMTDAVAELSLLDNKLQTQAITIAENQGAKALDAQIRLIQYLERIGLLDRAIEFLPADDELEMMRMNKQGLTRPELAVLLSYSKIALYNDLIETNVPDNDYLKDELVRYFPKTMRENYREAIESHQLGREIIATATTNSIINRTGITLFHTITADTGMKMCDVARSYILTRDIFRLRALWMDIETMTGVNIDTQVELYGRITDFIEHMIAWFLRNCPHPLHINVITKAFAGGVDTFLESYPEFLSARVTRAMEKTITYYKEQGVPDSIATQIALLEPLRSACDIVKVSNARDTDIKTVGEIYFRLGDELWLGYLRLAASRITEENNWDRLAIKSIINDLFDQQRRLTGEVMHALCESETCDTALTRWKEENEKYLERYHSFIYDLKSLEAIDFAMLMVALRNLEEISAFRD